MILVTTHEVAGKRVVRTLGLVRGNTIRARHLGKDIMAVLRNVAGGEIHEYTKMLAEAREQAIDRLVEDAEALGANAVIGLRFQTSMIQSGAAEMGATRIIAIDVGAGPHVDARVVVDGGLIAVHQRVFSLMAGNKRRESVQSWTGVPLTYVSPAFADTDGFDFKKRRFFIEEGYRATREALALPTPPPGG